MTNENMPKYRIKDIFEGNITTVADADTAEEIFACVTEYYNDTDGECNLCILAFLPKAKGYSWATAEPLIVNSISRIKDIMKQCDQCAKDIQEGRTWTTM